MSEAKQNEALYRECIRERWGQQCSRNPAVARAHSACLPKADADKGLGILGRSDAASRPLTERRSPHRRETPPILQPLTAAEGAIVAIGCLLVAVCLVQLAIWVFV